MKRTILGFLILFILSSPIFGEQAPWKDKFEEGDFYIYVNSEKVDLFPIINGNFIAIRFTDQSSQAQIQQIISDYKLNEKVDLLIDNKFRVFAIMQTLQIDPYKGHRDANSKFLSILNDLLKEDAVEFISPIFQYGRSLQVLTGEVIIKFNRAQIKGKAGDVISIWQYKRGLKQVDYTEEEQELILRAKVTSKSGRNVFQIMHELHPILGEPIVDQIKTTWITEVSLGFAIIQSPIELRSEIYLLDSPEAYTGHTVGSKYRYVLTIEYDLNHFSEKDIQIHINELKLDSYILEAWIPINSEQETEIKPQFFEFYGKENISEPIKEDKKFIQEVEYVFSISQAGSWFFPSLKIIYSFVNPITRVKETRELVSDSAFIQVGSILPRDAQNVNNPVGLAGKIEKPEVKHSVFKNLAIICGGIAGLLFLLVMVLGVISIVISINKPKAQAEKSIQEKWQEFGEELVATTDSRREFSASLSHEFKAILGLTSLIIAEIEDVKVTNFLKKIDAYIHGSKDEKISEAQARKLLKEAEKLLPGDKNGN